MTSSLSSLHNTKTWIYLERGGMFRKRTRHSSLLWGASQISSNYFYFIGTLRRNPPEVRVTSGQKLCTKIIYIITETFCATMWNAFAKKKIIYNNIKRRKQILKFIWNSWKYWWNETDDEILPVFAHLFAHFSWVPMEIVLVLFQATIYVFRFKKM